MLLHFHTQAHTHTHIHTHIHTQKHIHTYTGDHDVLTAGERRLESSTSRGPDARDAEPLTHCRSTGACVCARMCVVCVLCVCICICMPKVVNVSIPNHLTHTHTRHVYCFPPGIGAGASADGERSAHGATGTAGVRHEVRVLECGMRRMCV
jgi:hypothetical protein